ncbi:MAG TPA: hypothetical protein VL334_11365 [Anaerolineae bacterium]|nr:hypothetical protein [Anaerolineae bacterium]
MPSHVEQAERYVFDACALIAYLNDEVGAKVAYRISLADSVALGLTQQLDASLVSSDHHEFDRIDQDGKLRFHWIR